MSHLRCGIFLCEATAKRVHPGGWREKAIQP
jgi:hypothetical protein